VPCYTWHRGSWGSCNLQVRSGTYITWHNTNSFIVVCAL
jgi:hypothetical protein